MENFDKCCDSNSVITTKTNGSSEKCAILKKTSKEYSRTIFGKSSADRSEQPENKLKKWQIVPKYRSVYLKRYVYRNGIKCKRRAKKTFIIPVFPVTRRSDNPFNVKDAVQNLRRRLMTNPLSSINDRHMTIGANLSYSNLENRRARTKNWESIRYKYQLDYKEKLKMERENYLKEYSEAKKMPQKVQIIDNDRPIYRNTKERLSQVRKEHSIINSNQRTSHRPVEQNQNYFGSNSETHSQIVFSGTNPNTHDETRHYYRRTEDANDVGDLVDLTKDCENHHKIANPLIRVEPSSSFIAESNRSKINVSSTIVVPSNSEQEIQHKSRREDFDFSIPFNESNILIKVLTPDGRNKQLQDTSTATGDTLKETRQYVNETENDDQTKTDCVSENQWVQYVKNLFNKSCGPQDEHLNKRSNLERSVVKPAEKLQANVEIPKDCPPMVATIRKPIINPSQAIKSNVVGNTDPKTYWSQYVTGRLKHTQPVVSNPRLVRPKVFHPSPYHRSETHRESSLHSEKLDEPIVTLPVRPGAVQPQLLVRRPSPVPIIRRQSPVPLMQNHSPQPVPMVSDQSNLPHCLEYVYGNHPNYHPDYMVRSNRIPVNVIGQTVFPPYDPPYVHYRNGMERIPPPAYIDPYYHPHNFHVPAPSQSLDCLPIRPTAPSFYRYPINTHPIWIYPHNMLER